MPSPTQRKPAAQRSERDRAVVLVRHLRDAESLTIAEIAVRLGRSPSTVAGYFSDPDGAKARRYKSKYKGRCERCSRPTAAKPRVTMCRSCWRDSLGSAPQ
jgi:ribosomal protein S14